MRWEPPVALALTVGGLSEMLAHHVHQPALLVCGAGGAAALSLRPRAPLAAPVSSLVLFAIPPVAIDRQVPMLGAAPNSISLMLALLLAVYFTGACAPTRRALVGLAAVLGFCALYAVGPGAPPGSSSNDMLAAFLFSGVVPWLAGFAVGWQQRARAADRMLEEARSAAAVERSRIAREVHDLVAHSVSAMVVQAEAAEALLGPAPDRSAESLRAVQQTGRAALHEMRRTVAALRGGELGRAAVGLDGLPQLLESMRTAGVPINVVTAGVPSSVPSEVDRSAYRVIQEALTNVLRHSDHTGALVRVAYAAQSLEVTVIDRGKQVRRQLPGGHGLLGLRERVAELGGHLDAGPASDGKHVVHASLPFRVGG